MPLQKVIFWSTVAALYENLYVLPFIERFQNLTKVLLLESFLALICKYLWPSYFQRVYPLYCYFFIIRSYRLVAPYLASHSQFKYYFVNFSLGLHGLRLLLLAGEIEWWSLDYGVLIMVSIILFKCLKFCYFRY